MGCARAVVAVVAFLIDIVATLTSLAESSDGGLGREGALAVALLGGRVLGVNLLLLLAVRAGLGHWPRLCRGGRGGGGSGEGARSGAAAAAHRPHRGLGSEVGQELSAPLAGPRPPPLLDDGAPAAASGASPGASEGGEGDGDSVARRIDTTVAAQREAMKKVERGLLVRNVLLILAYFYMQACTVYAGVCIVSMDTSSRRAVLSAVTRVVSLFMMNVEFPLLKGMVLGLTAGDPVTLKGVHEHVLYWADLENKGFAKCSCCNEKIGAKTGGYLTLQCRQCEPGRYGYGGFQVCMTCYRKNAVKQATAGADDVAGNGILRGDKGPRTAHKLTVYEYMRRLAGMMRTSTLVTVLFSVGASQFVSAYTPKAQGDCVSALVQHEEQEFHRQMAVFLIFVVSSALLGFAMSVAISILSTRLYTDMSVHLFKALLRQDIAFYDNVMTGQLTSRLQNDLGQAVSPINIIINSFIANIVMLIVGFVICLQCSWRLTLLAYTVLTPMFHITAVFSIWASKLMATQYTHIADAQGISTQALTNIRTVRAFGARGMEIHSYEGCMKKSMTLGLRSAWGQGFANLLNGLLQQGATFVILYYGGSLALGHQGFEVGSIITFTYLWNKLSTAFRGLNENFSQPVKAMSAGQRVFELLELQPDIPEDSGEAFPAAAQQVQISFQGVEFTYQSRPDKKVLSGVDLTVEAGKTTAVVGKSGCGKSTITKLLLRFYDPQAGTICLNARDLKDMSLLEYRAKVGIVSQDTQLFRLTMAQNIAYGLDEDAYTQEDVEAAARRANADEFIRALPEGYKTMVGEGGHDLSGGQKQRVSIARALVRRPRLLLLDEATSALDAENEALVQEALDSLMTEMQGTCTILVIAHRLSTIKDADCIVVLHEGSKVEEGTHAELLQIKDGRYATMIARQLQSSQGSAAGDGLDDDDGDEPSPVKQAKQAETEITRLLSALPEENRSDVLRTLMKSFRGSMGKGKGSSR